MVNRHTALKIRKTHRYLGLFIGIQFLLWTISGLYFSWTDIDEIHGDHFKNLSVKPNAFNNLKSPSELFSDKIYSVSLRDINNTPYYFINDSILVNAQNGAIKANITKDEAITIAKKHMKPELTVKQVAILNEVSKHHEYREKPLPAYEITFDHKDLIKAYVSVKDGKFQTVRHRSWRWFDFLWMTHTMDYQTRDNFNTTLLRVFSLFGLLTVLSGFLLWFTSSVTIRKFFKKITLKS